MKKENRRFARIIASIVIIFVMIIGLYMFTDWFSKFTGYFFGEDEKVKLAHCLTENGAEFYTSLYCADCAKQRDVFVGAFKFINVIDCGDHGELCPNIEELPAWYIDGEFHYGLKDFSELRNISNCEAG